MALKRNLENVRPTHCVGVTIQTKRGEGKGGKMATIGWYGPLIDLSKSSSHIGDFVQLVVFVHKSTPIQYKLSKGGEAIRTDIQVGDDTLYFFPVSIWKKQMGSLIVAGNVILLENVKIMRIGDVLEARTVQQSSLRCLVHPYESMFSGVDNLINDCRAGVATKEKLRKVIKWVQRAEPIARNLKLLHGQVNAPINWKLHEETQHQDCFSLLEVLHLTDSCKATFFASVGEMFLPITWRHIHETEEEMMFIRRRLCLIGDRNLTEDLICTGCQLCGTPLNSEIGSKLERDEVSLYCQKSSNRLHLVSLIYRPFMLYVWDESNYIPLIVRNKSAEILFGNIKADSVYSCYRKEKQSCSQIPDKGIVQKEKNLLCAGIEGTENPQCRSSNLNLYSIWVILLRTLLQPGKNGPLKFKVRVDMSKDCESGRYEMLSLTLPVL